MVLDSVQKSIQAFLAGAITSTPLSFNSQATAQQSTSSNQVANQGVIAGPTPVTIVKAPTSSSTVVTPTSLNVYNNDSVAQIVTLVLNNNGTLFTWYQATLQPGDNLLFNNGVFYVVSSDGSVRGVSPLPLGAASESTLVDLQTLFAVSSADQLNVLRDLLKQLCAFSEARAVPVVVDRSLLG